MRKFLENKLFYWNINKGKYLGCSPLLDTQDHVWSGRAKNLHKWIREQKMTMHKVFYPRDDKDRLYLSWKEGRRGLANFQDSVDDSIQKLESYIHKGRRKFITPIKNNTDNKIMNKSEINRKENCRRKQLDGRFNDHRIVPRQETNEISHD